jgi:hypothetical protein
MKIWPIKFVIRGGVFEKLLLPSSELNFIIFCRFHRIFQSDVRPLSKSRPFISSKYFKFLWVTQKNWTQIISQSKPTSSESFCDPQYRSPIPKLPTGQIGEKEAKCPKISNSESMRRFLSGRNDKATTAVCLVYMMLTNVLCFSNGRCCLVIKR